MQKDITYALVRSLKPSERPYEIRDRTLKGFICRVQPSGSMTFYVQHGRSNRKRLGSVAVLTVAQAREAARALLASVTLGVDPQARQGTPTLATYLRDEYEPWVTSNRKSGRLTLQRLRACFLEGFGEKRLTDILPVDVERWRTERLKAGIRPSTLNRDLTALKAALSKATDTGYLPDAPHPLCRVKLAKVDTKGPARYLTPDEETRLRAVLQGDSFGTMVLLALNTGLRRGELFALKWEDVSFNTKTLTVRGHTAKSGATRHIPLNTEAVRVLRQWKPQGGDGLIFSPVNVARAWPRVMAEAGITAFRFHDLRHTFASNLVMAGVDLNTVRELLGHADITMTLRYAHLAPAHKAEAVERLVSR